MQTGTPLSGRAARWLAGLAVAALAACGGGGGGTPMTPTDPGTGGTGNTGGTGGTGGGSTPPPALASALSTAQPGDLVAYFKTRLQQRAAQGLGAAEGSGTSFVAAPVATAAPAFSGTTVQEAGVDEDDLLKTDGAMVYALHPSYPSGAGQETAPTVLTAERIQANGTLGDRTTVTLNQQFAPEGMFLASGAGRLAVLSRKPNYDAVVAFGAPALSILPFPDVPAERKIALDLFSVAEAGKPAQLSRIELDGSLVGTRMIGNVLYVVSTWSPDLGRYAIPANASKEQADAALAGLGTGDLVPKIRVDGGAAQPLVGETDCLVQPANASLGLQLTTITAFDLAGAGTPRGSRCFVGGVETLYMSPAAVYLASSRQYWVSGDATRAVFPSTAKTDIHKFSLQGLQATYKGSGEISGHLGWDPEKKPYRMSEHNGDLRVLSFTGQSGWIGTPVALTAPQAASPATLTVLRESSTGLQAVATLPNPQRPEFLGKAGEQIYAVHFAGPQAYLVTFRRTDPLYVLDLSNPADPRIVGELTVPGYSDFLYPLANGKLLGVGKDADAAGRVTGLKVSLFDVATPASPKLLSSQSLGQSGSVSALDASRHGINLFTQGTQVQVALPVRVTEANFRTAYQGLARYVVDTAAGTLTEKPVAIAVRFDGTAADSAKYAKYDLGKERSVQMAQGAYYLSGGAVAFVP